MPDTIAIVIAAYRAGSYVQKELLALQDIDFSKETPSAILELAEYIRTADPPIQEIVLRRTHLAECRWESLSVLFDVIETCPGMKLDLTNNNLGKSSSEILMPLTQALEKSQIAELKFSGNPLSPDRADFFASFLTMFKNENLITFINTADEFNELPVEAIIEFFKAINASSLQKLTLTSALKLSRLTAGQWEEAVYLLESSKALRTLYLKVAEDDPALLENLLQRLLQNSMLKEFGIEPNPFSFLDEKQCEEILTTVNTRGVLRELDLSNMSLQALIDKSPLYLSVITDFISHCKLRSLSISNNGLSAENTHAIFSAVMVNKEIKEFRCKGNSYHASEESHLKALLASRSLLAPALFSGGNTMGRISTHCSDTGVEMSFLKKNEAEETKVPTSLGKRT